MCGFEFLFKCVDVAVCVWYGTTELVLEPYLLWTLASRVYLTVKEQEVMKKLQQVVQKF